MLLASRYRVLYRHSGQRDAARVAKKDSGSAPEACAGVKEVFAGGLSPASDAKSLRAQSDGKVLVTRGPYLETKEHLGGLSIVEAAHTDEVLALARKGAVVCRASGEVRSFFRSNTPSE